MCIICVDIQKGVLYPAEAAHNLREMRATLPVEHHEEVMTLIQEDARRRVRRYLEKCLRGQPEDTIVVADPGQAVSRGLADDTDTTEAPTCVGEQLVLFDTAGDKS